MIGDFFSWYFDALVDFWGGVLRLGLPQIVLLILILMWLRRARCRKACDESDEESCGWFWSGGWGGRGCCRWGCGYTCRQRGSNGEGGCDKGAGAEAEVEAEAETQAEVVEEAEAAAEADDS